MSKAAKAIDKAVKDTVKVVSSVVDPTLRGALDAGKALSRGNVGEFIGRAVVDPLVNVGTYGLYDYDPTSKRITGSSMLKQAERDVSYGLGEITGANAMRDANRLAEQALLDEEARRNQAMMEARMMQQNRDLMASQAAGAARRRSSGAGRSLLGYEDPSQQGDFLGL